jgi:hypothetical protein
MRYGAFCVYSRLHSRVSTVRAGVMLAFNTGVMPAGGRVMRLGPEFFRHDFRMFMRPDDNGGGGGSNNDDDDVELTDDQIEAMPDLTDGGKKALKDQRDRRKAERDARIAAETELVAAKEEANKLKREKAERERADQAEKDRVAAEAGQHEALAESRRVELERVQGELDTANDKIETLEKSNKKMTEVIDKTIKDDWKGLPAEVTELFSGADDDAIAKMEWLPKARKMAETLEGKRTERREGHGLDPDPKNTDRPTIEQEAEALRVRGNISTF